MKCVEAAKLPSQYFVDLFGFPSVPDSVGFQPGALFAVHRDTIRQHPLSLYKKILEKFFLGEMSHVNPETGHLMERFWLALWAPKEYICWDAKTDVAKEERNRWGQLARGRWHRTPKGAETDSYVESSFLSSGSEEQSERSSSNSSSQVAL